MTRPNAWQPIAVSDVERLAELLAKATPGPWQSMNEYQWDSIIGDIDGPDDGDMHYEDVADITSHHARSRDNSRLIVAAVNALPELLRVYRAWLDAPIFGADVLTEGGRIIAADLNRRGSDRVRLVADPSGAAPVEGET